MTTRPLLLALGFATAFALAFPLAAAETPSPTPEKCAERFAELLKYYPASDVTAYKLDGHNHDGDAKAKDANFRFLGWLFLSRKSAAEALVFKKASAALRSKMTFAADARNCFTPEFGLRLNNGEQELHLLIGLHCQAVEFHAGKATARYPLSELGSNAFRALFDELFAEKPVPKEEKVDNQDEDADKAEAKKILSRKVSFEFNDSPPIEALKFLDSLISVSVIVDPRIKERANTKDLRLKITDLPVHEALDRLCETCGLAWEIRDEAVFVTDPIFIDEPEMEIYELRDLMEPELEPGERNKFVESLRLDIMRGIEPSSWKKEERTTIDVLNDRLVVIQHPSTHKLIEKYLAKQRAIKNLTTRLHEGQRGEGQPAWILETQNKLERKVDYTFNETRFSDGLKFLDSLVSINIVTDPRIVDKLATKVTLSAKEEPAYRSYARLLEAAGLIAEYREEGGVGALYISNAQFLAADSAARKAAKLLDGFDDAPLVACKVEGMEAPNEAETPEATHLARWKILVARDVLEAKTVEAVRTVLTASSTYASGGAACFGPGMGFRLKKNDQRLDIVICLECHWVYFYLGEQRHHLALSDMGVDALKKLYEELFPAFEEQKDASAPPEKK